MSEKKEVITVDLTTPVMNAIETLSMIVADDLAKDRDRVRAAEILLRYDFEMERYLADRRLTDAAIKSMESGPVDPFKAARTQA